MRISILVAIVLTSVPIQALALDEGWMRSVEEAIPVVIDQYGSFIRNSSFEFQVSAILITAIIVVESLDDPTAVSSSGALGLMGVMPDTYAYIRKKLPHKHFGDDLFDPATAIRAGTAYLYLLHREDEFDLETPEEMAAGFYIGHNGSSRRSMDELWNHWYVKRVMWVATHDSIPALIPRQ